MSKQAAETNRKQPLNIHPRAREPAAEWVAQTAEPAAEWVPRASLREWKANPRDNDKAVAGLVASIKRFGFGAPIIARRADGEVIAGHTRLKAAEVLGLELVPVRYLDLDPADAHLLALADNKLGEKADWNDAAVAEILSGYGLDDAELAGFDPPKAIEETAVEEVDVSDDTAEFFMSVRGPVGKQPDAIDALRAALQALHGVVVDMGVV